jgi:TolB-like protein/Tfp pilus assembly protein PilF
MAALVLAMLLASGWYMVRGRNVPPSRLMIAVLPFTSAADDPLAGGLLEELITHLGGVQTDRFGVIARESALHFASAKPGLSEIARVLKVKFVIDGSIRRDAGGVRIQARMVSVPEGIVQWSDSFAGTESETYRLEQETSAHITTAVISRLFPHGVLRADSFHSTGYSAYQAYRQGRELQWNGDLEPSRAAFEKAVSLDPRYADAWAALSGVCVAMARAGFPPRDVFPRAAEAAERALELNSASAEAQNALANVRFWFEWNAREADQTFRVALRSNPSFAPAHRDYAEFLAASGHGDEALQAMARALQLDPLSAGMNLDSAWLLLEAHRFDEAAAQARRTLDLSPGLKPALACLERAQQYAAHSAKGPAGAADPYATALHYALSGDRVRAIRELRHAADSGSVMLPLAFVDPAFSSLRGESTFDALVEKSP